MQKLDCRKDIHDRAYLSIDVTGSIEAGLCRVPGDGYFQGYRGEAMQDPANGLRRISIPRTRVNKGKEKGRGCYTPALPKNLSYRALCFSALAPGASALPPGLARAEHL